MKVKIAIEPQAESPNGFAASLQRAVKANRNVPKFKSAGFGAGNDASRCPHFFPDPDERETRPLKSNSLDDAVRHCYGTEMLSTRHRCMCRFCSFHVDADPAAAAPALPRRAFLLTAVGSAVAASPALGQVNVGNSSTLRNLVPAEALESAARQQYAQMLAEARSKRALAPEGNPQLQRLRAIAQRLIPFAGQWNEQAKRWRWEVNLISSTQVNAWCMPGGKIAFYSGILDKLQLTDDETAMVMGHEMAHALREHARERIAKTQATGIGLSVAAQLFGLGQFGNAAANLGTQLLTLSYSRDDESEADLVGLEIAARGGFDPQASVSLWKKMQAATGGGGGALSFLSTHPSGPNRIRKLEANVPKVRGLYLRARKE